MLWLKGEKCVFLFKGPNKVPLVYYENQILKFNRKIVRIIKISPFHQKHHGGKMEVHATRDYAKFTSNDIASASGPWKPNYKTDKNLRLSLNDLL